MPAMSSATHCRWISAGPHYEMWADMDAGVIRVVSNAGLWSLDDVFAYSLELRNAVDTCRLIAGAARIIVDLTVSPVQKPQVASEFRRIGEIVTDCDRLAIVAASALVKLQIDRVGVRSNIRSFTSRRDACGWLEISEAFGDADVGLPLDRGAKAA